MPWHTCRSSRAEVFLPASGIGYENTGPRDSNSLQIYCAGVLQGGKSHQCRGRASLSVRGDDLREIPMAGSAM